MMTLYVLKSEDFGADVYCRCALERSVYVTDDIDSAAHYMSREAAYVAIRISKIGGMFKVVERKFNNDATHNSTK